MEISFREKFAKDIDAISDLDVLAAIKEAINSVEIAKKPRLTIYPGGGILMERCLSISSNLVFTS
jgi:PHP family Zn ribbon phosphoesterase